ncbi:MAG: type I secretion system permease/ATPase [Gammaproteobacteria bacterium]|nr:type I secretion system permease/ATPase [Gammaproteobacteria bacterium]
MDPVPADSGLACLLLVARFHHVPAAGDQLRHRFGRAGAPFGVQEVLRGLRHLGLKARAVDSSWRRLDGVAPPCIVVRRDGGFAVVGGFRDDRVLVHDPADPHPQVMTRAEFEDTWSGRVILVTRRATRPDGARPFGFAWFLPALMQHRRLLGEVLVASLFVQLFALLTPLFFQVVIDKVMVHRGYTTLHVLAVGMMALLLFDAVLGGLRTYVLTHTSSRIDVTLGARLYRHLLRLPVSYFEARRVGDTVARVRELETIRQFLTGSTLTLVIDVLFIGVFIAVMFFYSPLLTWAVLGTLPLYGALSVLITPVLRRRLDEKFDRGAENQAFLVESVTGIGTLKAMAVEPAMERRWEEQLAAYVRAAFRTQSLGNIAGQMAGFLSKATTVMILWIGADLVIRGELSVGQLIAFNMLAGRVSGPILRLVQMWQEFQQAGISVRRLGDVLNAPPEPTHEGTRLPLPRLAGRVEFQQVGFRYRPGGPEVLRGVSFDVRAGQTIGIVGASGSGKSTIARLILRLHVPERGRVLVDGMDLAQADPVGLRRQIGVVEQEGMLFHRTVRENIALADPGVPMERVTAAARLAGAHDFILAMPHGYDTRVGEHGATLSGGQRQRIAIARALITDPRILIFDEATSALDYESEAMVLANMDRMVAGRTAFVIAHRLSTLRRCDRILVLADGRVTEDGDHDALVARGGYYARLHRMQQGPLPAVAN